MSELPGRLSITGPTFDGDLEPLEPGRILYAKGQVLDTPRLDVLAAAANARYRDMEASLVGAINDAVLCGEALLEAWSLVSQEEWAKWCGDHLDFTLQHAGSLMRLAHYKEQLPEEVLRPYVGRNGRTHQPSYTRALSYIKGLPPLRPSARKPLLLDAIRPEAKRLRKQGLSYPKIAGLLGVAELTVYRALNPEASKRYNENVRRRRKEASAARRALASQRKQAERKLLAKASPLGDAYSHVRRALDELESLSGDRRVEQWMAALYRVEDQLGEAMRAPK